MLNAFHFQQLEETIQTIFEENLEEELIESRQTLDCGGVLREMDESYTEDNAGEVIKTIEKSFEKIIFELKKNQSLLSSEELDEEKNLQDALKACEEAKKTINNL